MEALLRGRDAELAAIADLLDEAAAAEAALDRRGALVLRGEAGIGKSALLGAAHRAARERGFASVTVVATPAHYDVPFAGVHDLLHAVAADRVAGDGETAAQPRGTPFEVGRELLRILTGTAGRRPLLVTVDDAQWLDSASWEAFTFVFRRLGADPVAAVLTFRDGEEAQTRLARAGLAEWRVEPLSETDAATVLDERVPGLSPVLRARVLTESGGNPLGLVELGAAAARFGDAALLPSWLPMTTRLERTFGLVLAELPPVVRSLLQVATLTDGSRLDEILAATSWAEGIEVGLTSLEPAVAARMVTVEGGTQLRFRHPLVRSAVAATATAAQRLQGHEALARVVTDEDQRAWHNAFAVTGVSEAAADALFDLGRRGRERGAVHTAAAAWERAAQLTGDPGRRAIWRLDAADMAHEAGDAGAVARLMQLVIEHDLTPFDRARFVWSRESLSNGGWTGATQLPVLAELADRMRADGATEPALRALVMVSLRCWWSNPDSATRSAIIDVAERLDVSPVDPRMVSILGVAAPIERGRMVQQRLSVIMPRMDLSADELYVLGTAAAGVGAAGPATSLLAAAVTANRQRAALGALAQALTTQGWLAAQLGDATLAMTAAAEARQLAVETAQPSWALTADLVRACAEALRGNGTQALALAEPAERVLLSTGAHPMLALVRIARGVEALVGGRHAAAHDELRRVFDPADLSYHVYARLGLLGHLVDAGVRSGQDEDLRAVVDELRPIGAVMGSPVLDAGLRYADAMLASAEEAENMFRAALEALDPALIFEGARLQLSLASWLRRQRRPTQSRPLLRAAADTFQALGTTPWSTMARAELRASGETVRRPDDARGALTPQELQIVQLAAQGLSNPEIAERLFLSRRTVSTHLYRIFPKIGVSSRGELAAFLADGYVS